MNKQRILQGVVLGLLLALLLNITSLWAESNASYTLTSNVFGNGGGTISAGKYQLSLTIGEPITGNSSGGTYTIQSGFWANASGTSAGKVYLPLVQR